MPVPLGTWREESVLVLKVKTATGCGKAKV